MAFMKRVRLDDELISQGICADRADALRTLMAGLVSPGLKVNPGPAAAREGAHSLCWPRWS